METNEKNLSPSESLAIIQSMIATSKNNLTDDGFHFLLWGILVMLASVAQYTLAVVHYEYNFIPWMIMPLIGAPIAAIYERRKTKHEKVKSHFDIILGYVWMGAMVTTFIVIFASVKNQLAPFPFILAVVGAATFVSGNILKFKSLIFGAVIFWIAAFACVFVDPVMQLLLNAIATFIGYIIPGILLWRGYKAQQHVQAA
jgi:hypothetical protein